MPLTLDEALRLEREHGYEVCTREDHGYNQPCEIDGVTAPALFVLCPIVQITPRPTLLFHSISAYLRSAEKHYGEKRHAP